MIRLSAQGYSGRGRSRPRHAGADAVGRRVIEIHGTTTLVGLLGWPTSHSLSPRMQNAGFAALGLDWAYVPLPTPPELLGDAVRGLVATGFAGANVTIPHKQAVVELCDELDEVAERAGSVNTLVSTRGACSARRPTGRPSRPDRGGGAPRARARHRRRGEGRRRSARAWRAPRSSSRAARARWPPRRDGFDVLVNARR